MEFFTNYLSASILHAAGWTVVHSLWMGAAILVLTVLAQFLFGRRNAALRYILAFAGQLLLLTLSVATFLYYFHSFGQSGGVHLALAGTFSPEPAISEWTFSLKNLIAQHTSSIAIIWLIGVFMLTVKMSLGYHYIRQMRRKSWLIEDERILALVDKVRSKMHLKASFELRTTSDYITPLLSGIFKPFVLFPIAVINALDMDEVECILAHELAHLKRYDHLAVFIQQIIETLLYFNPAIWILGKQLDRYREEACDDLVVSLVGSEMSYARSLVKLQELKVANEQPRLALSALGHNGELLNRIKRIMKMEKRNNIQLGRLFVLMLLPLALVLLSFYSRYDKKHSDIEKLETKLAKIEYFNYSEMDLDTVPVPKSKTRIIEKIVKNENGKEIEAEFENDELKYLKVEGQEVDPEDSEEYKVILEELKEELADESGQRQKIRMFKFSDEDGNESDFEFEFDEEFDDLKMMETEDGVIFKMDENNFFEWKDDEGQGMRFFFKDHDFNLDELMLDLENSNLELLDEIEELRMVAPDVIMEEDGVIILRNGDEDMVIELNSMQSWAEKYSEQAEEWGERFGDDMAKWAEKYSKNVEKWAEKYGENAEKWAEEQEEYWEKQGRQMERQAEMRNDRMKRMEDEREMRSDRIRDRADEMRMERDVQRKRMHDMREFRGRGRTTLQDRIEQELRSDGFMSDNGDYTFKLNDKKLRINGKKQSDALYNKYKEIYEKYTGVEIEKGSTFSTSNTGI